MRESTQTNKILQHLKEKKHITSMEAFELYGATRLSAIIYNLKRIHRFNIDCEIVEGVNRYGDICRYGVYTLVEE